VNLQYPEQILRSVSSQYCSLIFSWNHGKYLCFNYIIVSVIQLWYFDVGVSSTWWCWLDEAVGSANSYACCAIWLCRGVQTGDWGRCSMYLTSLLGLECLLFIIVDVINKFSTNDWKHSVMNVWQLQSSGMWHCVVCLHLQSWRNSTLKMETECFFETVVRTYNSTWHHIAEDHNTNTYCLEYLQISWIYEIQIYADLQIIVTWNFGFNSVFF